MKRLIFIIVVIMAMCMPALGVTYSANDKGTFNNAYQWTGGAKDRATVWAQDIEALAEVGVQLGPGSQIWYVDSGRSASGDGTAWNRAVITLEEANVLSLADSGASRGDYILVAPGHAETLTGADAVDLDVIGITVIGLGNGSLKPTFSMSAAADEFAIGVDNVSISNLKFSIASSAVAMVIDIQDGVDYAVISNCEFVTSTTTGAPKIFINLANNNTGCVIANNTFDSQQTLLSDTAIKMDADTNQTVISNNLIQGDYLYACIWGDTTLSTEILIKGNLLVNGSSDSIIAQPAIDLLTGTTGYVIDNYIVCNVATVFAAMETADAVMLFNNWYNEDVGAAATAAPWHIGSVNTLTVIDSVSASGDG